MLFMDRYLYTAASQLWPRTYGADMDDDQSLAVCQKYEEWRCVANSREGNFGFSEAGMHRDR